VNLSTAVIKTFAGFYLDMVTFSFSVFNCFAVIQSKCAHGNCAIIYVLLSDVRRGLITSP